MKKILLVTLISVSLFACKKGSDIVAPIDEDKKLIDSVTILITAFSPDAKKVVHCEYDNENRMVALHEKYYNFPGPTADHTYTYDAQGNLVKSTVNTSGNISTFEYTYTGGAPTSVLYKDLANPANNHTFSITTQSALVTGKVNTAASGEKETTVYLYSNGNSTTETDELFSASGTKTHTLIFNYEYGSNKNPYLYSGYKWLLPDVPFANKNEVIKSSTSNDGSSPAFIFYTTTYDKNGYPLTVTTVGAPGVTAGSFTTYKYIYAK